MGVELIKYGWYVHDVVFVEKTWCPVCTKARVHEQYGGWMFCIGCGEKTDLTPESEAPAFKIDQYIKENIANES